MATTGADLEVDAEVVLDGLDLDADTDLLSRSFKNMKSIRSVHSAIKQSPIVGQTADETPLWQEILITTTVIALNLVIDPMLYAKYQTYEYISDFVFRTLALLDIASGITDTQYYFGYTGFEVGYELLETYFILMKYVSPDSLVTAIPQKERFADTIADPALL